MSAVATNRYPQAVLLSTLLHGVVIAALFLFTYVIGRQVKESPSIMELVQGEGDNYAATAAPALGSPDAVKLDAPPMPKNEPAPAPAAEPEPATPPPAPIEAVAPIPAPQPVPKPVPAPNLTKTVQAIARKNEQNTKKIRADEQKKADAEARAMTKEQFDKLNKGKSNPAAKPGTAPKIPQVQGMGIAKGVPGGSTANTVGGAGGKALTREDGDLMDAYFAMFKDRLLKAIEPPPGVSDSLVATVTATITASGGVTGGKITSSSGNDEFDRAILAALGRVRMAARPDHRSEAVSFVVRLRDISGP